MIRQIDSINFPNDWIKIKISAIGKGFKGKGISKSEVVDLKLVQTEIETLETNLTKVKMEIKNYLQELGLN